MRPSSSPSEPDGLLSPLFGDPDVDEAIADRALVTAMLRFESELAAAQAGLGLVPPEAAAAIAATAGELTVDPAELGRQALGAGNPVNPLVRQLTAAVPESARPFVHRGATSQDVLDTGLMLVARQAADRTCRRLDGAASRLVELIADHRHTPMPARTLGQQALPTTFGRVAAGWLTLLDDAAERLEVVARRRLAVQFGGAAGTLAGLDDRGPELMGVLAGRLGLVEPALPWHSDRQRILDLGAALGGLTAATGKVALDLVLLAQSELGEVVPAAGGGSTAMPHKANPVDAILVRSAATRTPGLVATLFTAAAAAEHERPAGAWHAEWETLRELLSVTGGAANRLCAALTGLRVDAERMRADLDLSGGLLLSESLAARLAPALGRDQAHDLVRECAQQAAAGEKTFDQIVRREPRVRAELDDEAITATLAPESWLGSADALVDRALRAHAERSQRRNG